MSSREMPKAYEPSQYEDAIYAAWEKSGMFDPEKLPGDRREAFSIVLPPPNVTGTLHLGHAAMLAIEDAMTRHARLAGKKALWLPGTDHAAIATQTKVEKELVKKGVQDPRKTLGRDAFLKEVNAFAAASHDTIVGQVRKMGASVDWSREAYTLDDVRNRAVNAVFKQMHADGLIYRGFRIVNWDPVGQTVIADDEIVYKEEETLLYTFKYGHLDKNGKVFDISISTTRPETKVGDTAVAVNPSDERYKHLIGEEYEFVFCGNFLKIKVVGDNEVDPNFGTGALGVTPAHSAVDWDIAERNNLFKYQVIGEDGRMLPAAGRELGGKTVGEARKIVIDWLNQEGLMTEPPKKILHNLATAERTGATIEPLPKVQWFIGVNRPFAFKQSVHAPIKGLKDGQQVTLKQLMQHVVREGEVKILPERFDKTYFHWIDNLRDWNISRQIWFGHRVPVGWCYSCNAGRHKKEVIDRQENLSHLMGLRFVRSEVEQEAETGMLGGLEHEKALILRGQMPVPVYFEPQINSKKCKDCGNDLIQDPDTLDTWFSSGLWTFSTLLDPAKATDDVRAWANASRDFQTYHPTAVLETGYDILFFWVARMILMTTYAIGEVPFRTVYLHGLVRDEQGRKMSKSLGNIIDPVDMIQKYGADATRLALILGSTPGNDLRLSEEKIAGFRNFTNKLWNISRFVLTSVANVELVAKLEPQTLADKWILSRFARVETQVGKHLENFSYSAAGETLRDFTWGDFADWYLEIAKIQRAEFGPSTDKNLLYILSRLLALWHPFMPFVTEEIWKQFGTNSFLMTAEWPKAEGKADENVEAEFAKLQEVIVDIRNLRSTNKVTPVAQLGVEVLNTALYQEHGAVIRALARVRDVDATDKTKVATANVVLYLPSVDPEKERTRLTKELEETKAYVASNEAKLANAEFTSKAPAKVIDGMRAKKAEAEAKVAELEKQLAALV